MTAAPKNFSFNLTLIDHAIVNALQEALEHIMPEIMTPAWQNETPQSIHLAPCFSCSSLDSGV